MSEVPNIDGVIERAVESANSFHERLRAARSDSERFRMVMERVEKHDFVVAVWRDARERNGVGFRLIKGQQKLATIADESAQVIGIVGLPCIDARNLCKVITHPMTLDAIALRKKSAAGSGHRR